MLSRDVQGRDADDRQRLGLNTLEISRDGDWQGGGKVTKQKRPTKMRYQEEQWFSALFDLIDEGFCIVETIFDGDGKVVDCRFLQTNPAFERQTGLLKAVGKTILELAPGQERRWLEMCGRIAVTGGPARFEERGSALGQGYDVHALRIDAPEQRRVAILLRDHLPPMHAEAAPRESAGQQAVLVAELQHRTRNLLGVIRAMADKTERASADLADFRERFHDRLEALARVQGLLSCLNEHDRVTFDELIEGELEALDSSSADHVSLEGPRGVRLRSSMVQTLAMALHELATNAVKYGALGQAQGKLAVTWSLDSNGASERSWLHIDWRESGVVMPLVGSTPAGGGQGRELIEQALPYQLGARTSYELGADGVHCTISMPVSSSLPSPESRHA